MEPRNNTAAQYANEPSQPKVGRFPLPRAPPYNGHMEKPNLDTPEHPFARLDPAMVLDALDSVGLHGDGRLLALNSYENRVYQAGREEGAPVVVKFYRPQRWSDAAILEEHAFVSELVEQEIPVVPALAIDGKTLHDFEGFRLSLIHI